MKHLPTGAKKTRMFALSAACVLCVILLAQVPLNFVPTPSDLNTDIQALAIDSSESNFILGVSSNRLPTPLVPFPTSSGAFTIESDSSLDGPAGIGAREVFVEVIYEDTPGNFSLRSVIISESLIIPVLAFDLGGTGVRRIRRMQVLTVGDQEIDQPVGTIVAKVGGVPCSEILPGRGRSELAVWTTPPFKREQINTAEVGFVASQGGLDWEVFSTMYTRQFAEGHGWVALPSILAREPQLMAGIVLNVPFILPPLTDVKYRVEATEGSDRSITFFAQITKIN